MLIVENSHLGIGGLCPVQQRPGHKRDKKLIIKIILHHD